MILLLHFAHLPHLHVAWHALHYLISLAVLVVWVAGMLLLVRGRHAYRSIVQIPLSGAPDMALPSLSILVPACNEAATIGPAMRSLLALDYLNLEIIAVDDRSSDGTGEILDCIAAQDSRLSVIHVTSLPDGWLGKSHALQLAGEAAGGEWLLLTDADVVFQPRSVRRAVEYSVARQIDHLVLAPRCETHGFWEKLFISYFGLMFSFRIRPWDVADPRKRAYVGLGAFNLVRASAYRAFGGHRALPMEVADDTKLGKVVKRAGFRQEILDGSEALSVRWVVGLRGAVAGLEKNAFAGFDFKLPNLLAAVAALAVTGTYPVIGLLTPGPQTRAMAAASLLLMMWGAGVMRRVSGGSFWYGLAFPLGSIVFVYIILRSVWRAYRLNGVHWRGTHYPLEQLRRGVV
ncbi:MAG TPA: glycosyltransferase family 2 protein [Chthonomonadales bacterium]|nr:glycosyltransferase family 2 protein [Chthonomonadales bacterium]